MNRLEELEDALPDAKKQQSHKKTLPDYWLNPKSLLEMALPKLCIGDHKIETTASAPSIKISYTGDFGSWDTFGEEVIKFYEEKRTQEELERCKDAPIYMDPKIRDLSSHTMIEESLQNGAEISISGRFFQNVLAVVTQIIKTIADKTENGESKHVDFVPSELSFGDGWIVDKDFRMQGKYPDVVLKLPTRGKDQVRMVGELKFCGLKTLEDHIVAARKGGSWDKLRDIFGQLIDYMVRGRVKYGFHSNYRETVFLKLETHLSDNLETPTIYFSDIITGDDTIDTGKMRPNLRLALFHLTVLTSRPVDPDWEMKESAIAIMKKKFKYQQIRNGATLAIPWSERSTTIPSDDQDVSTPSKKETPVDYVKRVGKDRGLQPVPGSMVTRSRTKKMAGTGQDTDPE